MLYFKKENLNFSNVLFNILLIMTAMRADIKGTVVMGETTGITPKATI